MFILTCCYASYFAGVCVTTQGNCEYEGDIYEASEQVNALFMMLQLQLSTEAFTAFSTLVYFLSRSSCTSSLHDNTHFLLRLFLTF